MELKKYKTITNKIRNNWSKIILTSNMWQHWGEICDYIDANFQGYYSTEMVKNEGVIYVENEQDAILLKLTWN